MNLQGKVASFHGVEEVEANGKLGAKPAIYILPEKLSGVPEHQIYRRGLNTRFAKTEQQTVSSGTQSNPQA